MEVMKNGNRNKRPDFFTLIYKFLNKSLKNEFLKNNFEKIKIICTSFKWRKRFFFSEEINSITSIYHV